MSFETCRNAGFIFLHSSPQKGDRDENSFRRPVEYGILTGKCFIIDRY